MKHLPRVGAVYGVAAVAYASACGFLVEPTPPGIEITPNQIIIAVGESFSPDIAVFSKDGPAPNAPVRWESESAAVARVDQDGTITGVGPGSVIIRASSFEILATGETEVVVVRQFWWVDAGHDHTCGLASRGRVFCWGDNTFGQLGDGTAGQSGFPVAVGQDRVWGGVRNRGSFPRYTSRRLVTGGWHTCAVTTDSLTAAPRMGDTFCWGRGTRGQLGDGASLDRTTPVRVDGGVRFESLAAGTEHTCGVEGGVGAQVSPGQATGLRVYCWGANDRGQIGDGTTVDRNRPAPVAGEHQFQLVVTAGHSCGMTVEGRAWCWGPNESGQLGDGTTEDSPVPVPAAGGLIVETIAVGPRHTCVLSAGIVYCWGANTAGQLGREATDLSTVPVPVMGLAVTEIPLSQVATSVLTAGGHAAAGNHYTCAARDLGFSGGRRFEPMCWGSNAHGQLGDGTTTQRADPAPVAGPAVDMWVIRAGATHTCALTTGGEPFCWGSNAAGQLGTGTVESSAIPRRVADPMD